MASINGISVKSIKQFLGHEGEPLFQGDLYLNNKKIGFWSQDAHGAICDNFQLDNGYSEGKLREAIKKANADKAYMAGPEDNRFLLEYDLESLMGEYISLYEDEKLYKNAVKKGYAGVIIASDGYHAVSWAFKESLLAFDDKDLLDKMETNITNAKNTFFKENEYTKHTVKIYRSPNDFVIGEPIKLEDVALKPKLQKTIESCEKHNEKINNNSKKDKGQER